MSDRRRAMGLRWRLALLIIFVSLGAIRIPDVEGWRFLGEHGTSTSAELFIPDVVQPLGGAAHPADLRGDPPGFHQRQFNSDIQC